MKKWLVVCGIVCCLTLGLGSVLVLGEATEGIPQRSEIDPAYQWRLEDIYADTLAWAADYARVKEALPTLKSYKGRLTESGDTLLACLQLQDSLWTINDRMYVYAFMKSDSDTRLPEYQALSGRAMALNSEVAQAVSFIAPEILAADAAQINTFIANTPGLKLYEHYLRDILRQRAHTLSPREEELLAMAADMAAGPRLVFNMLDDADIEYGTIIDEDGNEIELTKQRYYKALESKDRRVRREATDAYNSAYLNYVNTLGANLATSVKKDWFFARARKYATCLEASLDKDSIPVTVYENLIATANDHLEPLHRMMALRKRVLGLDTLYKYDTYVPLVAESDIHIEYDQAIEDVLAGLEPLGEDYVRRAAKGLQGGGWVDVYETEGKASGGYQWGSYGTHPYILLNYSNTIQEVFTLAHELGHAIHHVYTNEYQPFVYSNASLFTAEVASITNEMLLMDYLLKTVEDPELKKYILNYQIEQFIGTFYTQCMFSEFEHEIHKQVEAGEGLSAAGMRETYRNIYRKYWGPELHLREHDDLGGLRISHFYRNYYVYQYATSLAAAFALADKIIEGEDGAVERYLAFLKAGGSQYPVDLLKTAGVDMTTPDPIIQAVKRFDKMVSEYEELVG